jgi:penicillin V acylase-like amidase (Ntn superfamily)
MIPFSKARASSLVIEFQDGKETIYDNPVGVLTRPPRGDQFWRAGRRSERL